MIDGMKLRYVVSMATLFTVMASACVNRPELHRLDFETPAELHRFFAYGQGRTIISGHRGTVEHGLAENCIEGMEAVLQHTPAFFEIDPRMTKDSVVVLMHDATLDRTTT